MINDCKLVTSLAALPMSLYTVAARLTVFITVFVSIIIGKVWRTKAISILLYNSNDCPINVYNCIKEL